jgi:UDPglucose 6-dehydrogenase
MIGTGYVGLVSAACFSDFGHSVVAYDNDKSKIDRLRAGEIPIYEPGLADLVERNTGAGRLRFTASLEEAMSAADVVFIAVGTPSRRGDGYADLSYVFAAAEAIATKIGQSCVVVCKSTVPVGTNRRVLEHIRKARPDVDVHIASNPEFLREGSAIEDFKRPDRVIIGAETDTARNALAAIYRPLSLSETPIVFTDLETAELIKYAANAFLATKISFINEIADLCDRVGANVQGVAHGIGLDRRIGSKFLHAGPGYGGSCFPKDTLALLQTARDAGVALSVVEAGRLANETRKDSMAERIVNALGGSVEGKSIAVLGLSFKPNTDDIRDAPSLSIIPALQSAGASVRVHDPECMAEVADLMPGITTCAGPYEAVEGVDAVVIITEWDIYRALDLALIGQAMRGRAFIDLRGIYQSLEVATAGLEYFGVGVATSAVKPDAGEAAE